MSTKNIADVELQLQTMTSTVYSQGKDMDQLKKTLKELISFIEYEEAYTADPKTQQRIRKKLKELKVWN